MTKSDINKTLTALKRQQAEQAKHLKAQTLEKLENNYITYNEQKLQRYKKLKTDKQRKIHLLEFFKKRSQMYYNEVEQELNEIYNDTRIVSEVKIYADWSKSRTWGACPKCEGYIRFADNSYLQINGSRASGYGYDKLSTTIAEALNKCTALKRMLYDKRAKKATHRKATKPHPLYFEGGAGIMSFIYIFKSLNFEVTHEDCKTIDILHCVRK